MIDACLCGDCGDFVSHGSTRIARTQSVAEIEAQPGPQCVGTYPTPVTTDFL